MMSFPIVSSGSVMTSESVPERKMGVSLNVPAKFGPAGGWAAAVPYATAMQIPASRQPNPLTSPGSVLFTTGILLWMSWLPRQASAR
jgi:hypothetical protein